MSSLSQTQAVAIARRVYQDFLDQVMRPFVFSPEERGRRVEDALSDGKKKNIESGKSIDVRVPHLAAISGKGSAKYPEFTNVTLIDHLASVMRGALVIAALDIAAGDDSEDEAALRARLTVIAVIAFLHDIDKMLGLGRLDEIAPAHVAETVERYGLRAFLEAGGAPFLKPEQILALIHNVETTRAGFMRPGLDLPPKPYANDCLYYVKLADRLDGKFLGPDGVEAVLKDLDGFDLPNDALKRGWKVLRIEDPHTPFLLDSLLVSVSRLCEATHGFPPLIEIHHDGVMLAIVPEQGWEALVEAALKRATAQLGARIRPTVNPRGAIDLLDAPGDLDALRDALRDMKPTDRARLLFCQVEAMRDWSAQIDESLGFWNRRPAWGPSATQKLIPMWIGASRSSAQSDLDAFLLDAETLAVTLCCADPEPKAKLKVPPVETREAELLARLGDVVPSWIGEVADDKSRRMILSALAAAQTENDEDLRRDLLGPEGLAALWLEGRDGRPGLIAKIDASGVRLAEAVARRYTALLGGDYVGAADEDAQGRCHFTNQPVPIDRDIDGKTGLYGVKISAFSGRDKRREHFESAASHTLVSPIAEAEHRLRQINFDELARGRGGDTPSLLSSPTVAGLFGALVFKADATLKTFAITDLLRERRDDDRPAFDELDLHVGRTRVARYEVIPTKLIGDGKEFGQLDFVLALIRSARRLGRPVHLFRGLPRPNRAFVHFDFLPSNVERFLGGRSFRVEQLGGIARRLEGLSRVAETTGFGRDLALAVADPLTCFGAACDCLRRAEKDDSPAAGAIRAFANSLLEKEETLMNASDADKALIAFAEAMARVQRRRMRDDGGNFSEFGLRTAIEAVEMASAMRQADRDSLIYAVAGHMRKMVERRSFSVRASAREGLGYDAAFEEAAAVFVDRVWLGAFKGNSPASAKRRIALAIYSWAFDRRSAFLSQAARDAAKGAEGEALPPAA